MPTKTAPANVLSPEDIFKYETCAKNFPHRPGYIRLGKFDQILEGDVIAKVGKPIDLDEGLYDEDTNYTPYKYKKKWGSNYYGWWWYRPIKAPRKLTGNAFFAKELPLP